MFEIALWSGSYKNKRDEIIAKQLVEGGEELRLKMKTDLINEINDLYKKDYDLYPSNNKKFGPYVKRMSDLSMNKNI